MNDLASQRCKPCEGEVPALEPAKAQERLKQLDTGWSLNNANKQLSRNFKFKDYYETIAFVNATAWISHQEGHHPDLEVSYNHCLVHYTTHAIHGLSDNDFICAAKLDKLFFRS
jgi:4a-hydroxytetrahydrobiopterin dehydratase